MSHLTTHVLDAATGAPASGIGVVLAHASGAVIAQGATDGDGRLALGPDTLTAGDYTLTFLTGPYFAAVGVETFYPHVAVTFRVQPGRAHYHVPLLLSPFAYSTYRGS
jgi:5-hydroxyisourate hydrolase